MMPPKMVPCGFVSRGSSVMRMAGSPYEFMTEEWRPPAGPVKRGRAAYNDSAGGNIQTLVVIAEPPVFGLLHPADARKKLSETAARRIVSVKYNRRNIRQEDQTMKRLFRHSLLTLALLGLPALAAA